MKLLIFILLFSTTTYAGHWYTDTGHMGSYTQMEVNTTPSIAVQIQCAALVVDGKVVPRWHVKLNVDGTVVCPAEIDPIRRSTAQAAKTTEDTAKSDWNKDRENIKKWNCSDEVGKMRLICRYLKRR